MTSKKCQHQGSGEQETNLSEKDGNTGMAEVHSFKYSFRRKKINYRQSQPVFRSLAYHADYKGSTRSI